jgi:hypothetical protein
VRRVASRCLACKWTVPNLAWWSVPNFAWCSVSNLHAWPVPNLHACMSYLYVCMYGCTADICLYACMVNGKCGWLSVYVLALLYLLLLAIAVREGERREKWEVGPSVMEACELPQSARGVWARVHCGGDGGGVSARGVVGHRAKRVRGGER